MLVKLSVSCTLFVFLDQGCRYKVETLGAALNPTKSAVLGTTRHEPINTPFGS